MWEISQNRRVLFGAGRVTQAAQVLRAYTEAPVLVMAYSADAPCVQKVVQAMKAEGNACVVDDSLSGEPETGDADRIAKKAAAAGCGAVLAIGGGSVMDAAKAVAMLVTNGGEAAEYQAGARRIENRPLPLVAVPTTAGTGSEATKVSVLYNPKTRLKKSVYSPSMIAGTVILDPQLTVDLPRDVTVYTGIDALSHAIESYVSLDATPYTRMYSLEAIRLTRASLTRCVARPDDVQARGDMLLASFLGGVALGAGIGLAHIMAQPLGGMLKIPHGAACAVFLPHAMAYNVAHAIPEYCAIARAWGLEGQDSPTLAQAAVDGVKRFLALLDAPDSIRAYAPGMFDVDEAVRLVMEATGHIQCNPRPITRETVRETIQTVL